MRIGKEVVGSHHMGHASMHLSRQHRRNQWASSGFRRKPELRETKRRRLAFCLVPRQRAKLQGSASTNHPARDAPLSMISRTRLIITALLACHLFLQPGLLTSQLRLRNVRDAGSDNSIARGVRSRRCSGSIRMQPESLTAISDGRPQKVSSAKQPTISATTDAGQQDQEQNK